MNTVSSAPTLDQSVELREKVAQLEQALLSAHPTMPILLRQIHTQLLKDPEIVTILSEEEIGVIVNGLKKQTVTEIATSAPKAPSVSKALKAAIGKGSAEDLF